MNAGANKARAKRARRPIYCVVRRVVDLETGEQIGALVPAHPIDRRLMRERKFHVNREVRAELKQSRNPGFHRLAHAVGNLLSDNVEEFRHLNGHDALKQVQAKAGVCCDVEKLVLDLGTLGRHTVDRSIPRSIAFDEMDEAEFKELFEGVCDYIDQHYAGAMTDEIRAEYFLMLQGDQP